MATTEGVPLSERVAASYLELSLLATDLNAISDELGKSIVEIGATLKKLNLGIPAWVRVGGWSDPGTDDYYNEYIGYAKVQGKWGIALKTESGNEHNPFDYSAEEWPFNEGPRILRLAAIDKIPELLKKLAEETQSTTLKLTDKLELAQQVAATLKETAAKSTEPAKSVVPPRATNKSLGVQK